MDKIIHPGTGGAPRRPFSRRHFLQRTLAGTIAAGAGAAWLGCRAWPDRRQGGWQIGAYTRPWDAWDYRTALDGIAEAGFSWCGLMTAKSEHGWLILTADSTLAEAAVIGREIRQRGLQCLSLYAGEFPVDQSPAAGRAGLRKLIDLCAACGASNLMLAGVPDANLSAAYFQVIADCCDYAATQRVGLSLKPHGGFVATGAACRQGVARVGHPNFRIWYDPGNILFYSEGQRDPVTDAADVAGWVVGMSVKDFRAPRDIALTPGDGQVNWPGVMAQLTRGGFTRGPLLIECLESGDRARVLASARRARAFLEALTRSLS